MSASIDVTGLTALSKSLSRAVSGGLQKEMVNNLHEAGPKIVADMHGSAHTKVQRRGAGTVVARNTATGIEVSGGRGGGLGAALFDGAEYGGRESRKGAGRRHVPYQTRSRAGRSYFVFRRTTMQFLPYLGDDGYFFWPTIREWMPRLEKQQDAAVEKAMGGR